ncbi:MAG: relaxase/mobilization nuclease domain-containing protein [Defluviitaleaceae bacterium]|nr:relaxase/mobilization nuclease domain-containing protein [Defluviitaleaceae bacterium]
MPQQSHELAEKLAQRLFADHECVIATHADTDALHTHIIINAVSFETGKKLRMWGKDYEDAKDFADSLAAEMGLTPLDWRQRTDDKMDKYFAGESLSDEAKYLSGAERNMAKQGNLAKDSWKEALRQAIDEAKTVCATRAEFQQHLEMEYGVTMTRNTGKTVTFVHPAVGEKYVVRGAKLGADYTAAAIDQALAQNIENNERSPANKSQVKDA